MYIGALLQSSIGERENKDLSALSEGHLCAVRGKLRAYFGRFGLRQASKRAAVCGCEEEVSAVGEDCMRAVFGDLKCGEAGLRG